MTPIAPRIVNDVSYVPRMIMRAIFHGRHGTW